MRVKYPRTPHLPWSCYKGKDDVTLHDVDLLKVYDVVVTEKLDGECTTMYRDGIHARSLDSVGGVERSWVKGLHAGIAHLIPEGWRVCGENMWAKHSIAYSDLESFFYVFSIWNGDYRVDWKTTKDLCASWGLLTAPVLYEGVWDENAIRGCWTPEEQDTKEGYVVAAKCAIRFERFGNFTAKFVRPNHVTTDTHWRRNIVPNRLRGS